MFNKHGDERNLPLRCHHDLFSQVLRGQLEELSSAIKEAGRNVDETEQSNEKQVNGNLICCVHKPRALNYLFINAW